MQKRKVEMVLVNLFVGKSKKVWETIELPRKWIDDLQKIAESEGSTLDDVFRRAVREMMEAGGPPIFRRAKRTA